MSKKEKALTAIAVTAFIALGYIFWQLVAAFMWACYYAGIPM